MGVIGRNDPCPCGSGLKYKKCCQADQTKNNRLLWAMKNAQTDEEIKEFIEPRVHRYLVTLDRIRGWVVRHKVNRTIEILDEDTLFDLHLAIQDAFGWDNDHLFSFYLSDRIYDRASEYSGTPFGEHVCSTLPRDISSKPAADTELFQLQLAVGRQFKYVFDYGDDLIHTIQLTAIEPPARAPYEYPRIIKSVGKAPEQYP